MSAPRFAPVSVREETSSYESPAHVPPSWMPNRKAEIHGPQPAGDRLGYQGPDQGYALTLINHLRKRIRLQHGENVEDAVHGTLAIALKRASLFGRAPVIHDITLALKIWGWLDATAPTDLVTRRRQLFEGVGNTIHHYAQARDIADLVPESTLRLDPSRIDAMMPISWQVLTGA